MEPSEKINDYRQKAHQNLLSKVSSKQKSLQKDGIITPKSTNCGCGCGKKKCSKTVKGDLKVCGDAEIKGNLSVDGQLSVCKESSFESTFGTDFITETIVTSSCANKFHGWWAKVDKGTIDGFGSDFNTGISIFSDNIDTYIFIDTTVTPIKVTTWGGNGKDVRSPNPNYEQADRPFYYQKDENTLLSILPVDPGDNYTLLFGNAYDSLMIQPNGLMVATSDQGTPSVLTNTIRPTVSAIDGPLYGTYQKISALQLPQPMPMYDDLDYRPTDFTLPTNLFKYIFHHYLYHAIARGGEGGNPSDNWNPDFVGFYEANQIFEQYITTGKTYTSKIVKTGTTKNGSGMTNIYTDSFHFAPPGSTVEVSGFGGGWTSANNTYVNGASSHCYAGVPNPNPLFVDVQSADNVGTGSWLHHFYLDLDSSAYPQYSANSGYPNYADGSASPALWGNQDASISVTHRIYDDMEYHLFVAAVMAFFYDVFKVSQHTNLSGWADTSRLKFLIDTWTNLQQLLTANNAVIELFRTRTARFDCAYLFQNGAIKLFNYNPNPKPLPVYPWNFNDAYGMLPTPGSIYDYNVDAQNYLVGVSNLYYTLDGVPYKPQHTIIGQDFGYKNLSGNNNGGSYFISTVAPMNFANISAGNPDPNVWSLIGIDFDISPDIAANSLFFGFVNPLLTNGKKIGYIYMQDELRVDGFLQMIFLNFTKAEDQDSPRASLEGYARVWAPMMQYLNTQHPNGPGLDSIIFDDRSNAGGLQSQNFVVASLFGGKRKVYDGAVSFWRDNGRRLPQKYVEDLGLDSYNNLWSLWNEQVRYIYSDQTELRYGSNSVFKNGKVIILHSSAGASSGDSILYSNWLGENNDGDLGNSVTAKIIGSADGRQKGGPIISSNPDLPLQKYSERLYDANGNPVSALPRLRTDFPNGGYPVEHNGLKITIQNPEIAMTPAPTVTGLAGNNPLPEDFEHTYYIGFGFMQPYPYAPLPGWSTLHGTDQPDPNNNTTWRDPWLEQAILDAQL